MDRLRRRGCEDVRCTCSEERDERQTTGHDSYSQPDERRLVFVRLDHHNTFRDKRVQTHPMPAEGGGFLLVRFLAVEEVVPGEAGCDADHAEYDCRGDHSGPYDRARRRGVPLRAALRAAERSTTAAGRRIQPPRRTRPKHTHHSTPSKESVFPLRADGGAAARNAASP